MAIGVTGSGSDDSGCGCYPKEVVHLLKKLKIYIVNDVEGSCVQLLTDEQQLFPMHRTVELHQFVAETGEKLRIGAFGNNLVIETKILEK